MSQIMESHSIYWESGLRFILSWIFIIYIKFALYHYFSKWRPVSRHMTHKFKKCRVWFFKNSWFLWRINLKISNWMILMWEKFFKNVHWKNEIHLSKCWEIFHKKYWNAKSFVKIFWFFERIFTFFLDILFYMENQRTTMLILREDEFGKIIFCP